MKKLKRRIAICVLVAMIAPMFVELVPFLGSISKVQAAATYGLEKSAGAIGIQSTPARIHVMEGKGWVNNDDDVSFQSNNESVCSVDSYGYMEGKKLGTANITVTQKENGTIIGVYKVTVKESEMNKEGKGKNEIAIGEAIRIEQFVNYHSKAVDYQFIVDKSGVLDIDKTYNRLEKKTGKIAEGLKEGKTKVTIKEIKNGKERVLGSKEVIVHKAEIKSKKIVIPIGNDSGVTFLQYENPQAEYKFTSSNEEIIKFTSNSYAAQKSGTAMVSIKEIYKGEERDLGEIEITVSQTYLDIKKIAISKYSYKSLWEHIQARDSKADYTFQSDNTKIVSVDSHGSLTAVKLGKATVTVFETKEDKKRTLGKVTVSVENAVLGITEAEVGINAVKYPESYVECWDDENTTWKATSSDSKIIQVETNKSVRLIPKKSGTAKVTIQAVYKGKTTTVGTVTIKVVNKKAELREKETVIYLEQPECWLKQYLKYPNDYATYTYVLDNKALGTVDKDGTLKFKKTGTVKVTYYETYKGSKRKVGTLTIQVQKIGKRYEEIYG